MKCKSWPFAFSMLVILTMNSGCAPYDPAKDWIILTDFASQKPVDDQKAVHLALQRLHGQDHSETLTTRQRMILAAVYDRLDQPEKAIEQLAEVKDDSAESADARLSEGQIYFYKLRMAKPAEKSLLRAIELDAGKALAWSRLASLYEVQNRLSERNRCFLKLDDLSALDRDQLLLWTCNRPPDGLIQEKQKALTEFLTNDGSDNHSRLALAEELRRKGDYDLSLKVLSDPESAITEPLLSLLLTELYLDRGERDQAVSQFQKLDFQKLNQDQKARYFVLGARSNFLLGKFSEMESLLKSALQLEPLNREALQLIVQQFRLQKRSSESKEFEQRLSQIDQLEDLAQKARATLHRDDSQWIASIIAISRQLGQLDIARAWLRTQLTKDPLNQSLQQEIFQLTQQMKANSPN
jgi:tetratricopeptide (TPR) repeat protein